MFFILSFLFSTKLEIRRAKISPAHRGGLATVGWGRHSGKEVSG
jgi:hypothetical protein